MINTFGAALTSRVRPVLLKISIVPVLMKIENKAVVLIKLTRQATLSIRSIVFAFGQQNDITKYGVLAIKLKIIK